MTAAREQIERVLAARLSPARWAHSRAVADTAAALADRYGADREAAWLAGILHDCARELPTARLLNLAGLYGLAVDEIEAREPLLLHGKVGAAMARADFGLADAAILEAVGCHITGAPGMGLLARIIFLADFIEPGRSFAGVEPVREAARADLRRALLLAYESVIAYVHARGHQLHPLSLAARDELLAAEYAAGEEERL